MNPVSDSAALCRDLRSTARDVAQRAAARERKIEQYAHDVEYGDTVYDVDKAPKPFTHTKTREARVFPTVDLVVASTNACVPGWNTTIHSRIIDNEMGVSIDFTVNRGCGGIYAMLPVFIAY